MSDPSNGQGTSSSSDEDDLLFAAGAALLFGSHAEPYGGPIQKLPCRTSALSGRDWVEEVMSGHHTRIMDATRLNVDSFMQLCSLLAECGFVPQHHQKRVIIEEALAMTLVMMSHNMRMHIIADRFNHSTETVHRNIHEVIRGLCTFAQFIITPRNQDAIHPKILSDTRFYPWFEDCVRAIDGTHIPACVPRRQQVAYTNKHGVQSQNVLAVCNHDMRFIYVYAGWEGNAHDARVLDGALTGPNHFPVPPTGKYYLVDSAYRNLPDFLPPYRGRQADVSGRKRGRFATAKELFNYRHSALRNVIERSFGVLKRRFAILRGAVPNYMMTTQINVVIACCAVHNFIRDQQPNDMYFANPDEGDPTSHGAIPPYPEIQSLHSPPEVVEQWTAMRDTMATHMFNTYRNT
nr:putative nuclease HARBI1 [Coffea arabica]